MDNQNQLFVIGLDKELTTPEIKYVIYYKNDLKLDDEKQTLKMEMLHLFDIVNDLKHINLDDVSNLEAIHDLIVLLPYDGKDINDVYVTNDFALIDNGSIQTDTEFELKSINDFMSIKLDETLNDFDTLEGKFKTMKEAISRYYQVKEITGGSKPIEGKSESSFMSLIRIFIKVVNELLNIPVFKKFISLSIDDISRNKILPNTSADKILKTMPTIIKKNISFEKYNTDKGIHKQILNFLFNKDIEKGDMTFATIPFSNKNGNEHIISTKEFANEFLFPLKSKKFTILSERYDFVPDVMNFIFEHINERYNVLNSLFETKYPGNVTLFDILNKKDVQIKINQAIRNRMKTQVLTFLKIRNDEHNLKMYNRRFDIMIPETDKAAKHLLINYNDDNEKYYEQVGDNLQPTKNILNQSFEQVGTVDMKRKSGQKYDHEYVFGEFTKIFTPDKSNTDIASEMELVKNELKSEKPKPVFILGYGASGAGKTSSLIYFNKGSNDNEKNGILIQLCNQLGKEGAYSNIEIEYREFYNSGKDKNYTLEPINTDCQNAKFNYKEEGGFVLSEDYTHKNHHIYRIYKEKDEGKCDDTTNAVFKQGDQIGKVMIHLIDTDRHVKATTNNPNSSRSHSLIFVKLSNNSGKNAYLMVGDFAGVENVFDCSNPSVLTDFMSIKEDKEGSKKLFYEEEKCGDILDPIGSDTLNCSNKKIGGGEYSDGDDDSDSELPSWGRNVGSGTSSESDSESDSEPVPARESAAPAPAPVTGDNKKNLPVYDFENPVLNDDFKKAYPVLNKFEGNKPLLKAFIEFVRMDILQISEDDYKRVPNEKLIDYYSNETIKASAMRNAYRLFSTLLSRVDSVYKDYGNKTVGEFYKNLMEADSLHKKLQNNPNKAKIDNLVQLRGAMNSIMENTQNRDFESNPLRYRVYLTEKLGLIKGAAQRDVYNIEALKPFAFTTTTQNNKKFIVGKDGQFEYSPRNVAYADNEIRNLNKDFMEVQRNYDKVVEKLCGIYNSIKKQLTEFNDNLNNSGICDLFNNYMIQLPDNCEDMSNIQTIPPKKIMDKSLIEMFNVLFPDDDSDSKLFEFIRDMEYVRTEKLALSETVCDNRRTEGFFINDSLKQVRNVIREMLYVKNKNVLEVVPNYVDICFDQYCPNHENCFSFNKIGENKNSKSESVIFDQIFDYLNKNKYFASDNDKENEEKMYSDLLVCIFCVLNISKRANNPPPVPYIDINNLKRIMYFGDIFDKDAKEFLKESKKLLNSIESKYIYETETGEKKNRVNDLKNITIATSESRPILYKTFKDIKQGTPLYKGNEIPLSYELFKFIYETINTHHLFYSNSKTQGGGTKAENQEIIERYTYLKELLDIEIARLSIVKNWQETGKKDYNLFNKESIKEDRVKSILEDDLLSDEQKFQDVKMYLDANIKSYIAYYTLYENIYMKNVFMTIDRNVHYLREDKKDLQDFLNDVENAKKYLDNTINTLKDEKIGPDHINVAELIGLSEKRKEKQALYKQNYEAFNSNQEKVKKYILDLLNNVDNSNAISSIGTIEFIDRMSKLNTVATVCNGENIPDKLQKYKKDFNMKPLYETNTMKTGGKYSRKRRNIRNQTLKKMKQ